MSTTNAVDLGGVHVRGAWASPGGDVRAELAVYTKTGQARIAQLDERDLIRLIGQASTALGQLLTHRTATVDDSRLVRSADPDGSMVDRDSIRMSVVTCDGYADDHPPHAYDWRGVWAFCMGEPAS